MNNSTTKATFVKLYRQERYEYIFIYLYTYALYEKYN